ncbi:MAG: ATP-binding cassette domain-containing protein, partial [Candidatus Rokubacteria bacterium]|nr:ATP-binding cassette domain-containing protein [Candidatus Rokubacteria bacterium]
MVVRVLKGVTLSVTKGEVVALVGASGVGKSTLLHLLGALDRPTAGQVLFDGEDVFARSESGLARFRRTEVGFIFQFYNLLGEMTALENAMLPALLLRLPWEEARARAADALHEVGLGDRLNHRPGELSGGEQQRVAIARAVMHRPRLVL